jgi:glutathione S-transferase
MALPFTPATLWLLYAYPWMPYPRRIIIYLREKGIPESLIQVVECDVKTNDVVDHRFPSKPAGSLPLLVIPSEEKDAAGNPKDQFIIRQSMTIIYFLEKICDSQLYGFPSTRGSLLGKDMFEMVRINEVVSLAEECTIAW